MYMNVGVANYWLRLQFYINLLTYVQLNFDM